MDLECKHHGILTAIWESVVVQVVFSDESGVGNKKKEPITVVTAIVFNMDREWEPVSNALHKVVSSARANHKDLLERGRALKGKLLYGAIRRKNTDADTILRSALQIIADHTVTVFYGAVDRDEFENYRGLLKLTEREKTMTPFDKAFEACFSIVDRVIRSFTNEQILWIADRSDRDRESATRTSLFYHRLRELKVPKGLIVGQFPAPLVAGASRIADTVYFGSSHESVALQLADVCCSTITLKLLEQDYEWSPVVEPYYEILRPSILNHGTPVLFPRPR